MNHIESALKSFLQQPYQDSKAFLSNVIFPVFGEENFESAGNLNVLSKRPDLQTKANATGILEIHNIGILYVEGSELDIFDITIDYKKQLQRNRVEIQQIIRSILSSHSGAFILFHYQSGARWEWRFTFCHKGASADDSTDAKRYTFLLGPGQSCRTAAANFTKIHEKIEKEGSFEMQDIIEAFDVEALSKEFFGKYKAHYEKFCNYVYENRNDESKFGSFFATCEDKVIRDYVKKLLGRLVFLQFLQKKRWLGGTSSQWDDGDPDFLQHLFKQSTPEQKNDFLDTVLEPLFQNALDGNRAATNQDFDTGVEGFRSCKVPYLNGGLFSQEGDIDDANSDFPADYFEKLFSFFAQYNFTIDENDPTDAEIGIDPEMLGRIFENLLEDNKDKGAFYTPKAIVQYMCKESLIAYLQNGCCTDRARNAAREFVQTHDAEPLRQLYMQKADGSKTENSVLDFFDEMLRKVKICDPAIGSGAFPMGLLRELYACRAAIEDLNEISPAAIKKEIIQNNIYGVDIEKGAVDIARLRFWLSLILDEEDPKALPNLDFKIMQGNSLLESFHGVDLSLIAACDKKTMKRTLKVNARTMQGSLFFQDEAEAMKEIQQSIRRYYATDSHSAKQMIYQKIENATRQYLLHLTEGRPDLQEEIENLPLCNDQYFLWHTFFADVFANGGFDIVIGNPPYVNIANIKPDNYRETLKSIFYSAKNKADLYAFFVEFGFTLLNKNGILSYIIPHTWKATDSFYNLRDLLVSDHTIMQIVNLDMKIFDAVVCPLILLSKNIKTDKYSFDVYDKFTYKYSIDIDEVRKSSTLAIDTESSAEEKLLLSKIAEKGCSLGSILKFSRGIKTSNDSRFVVKQIIDENCKHVYRGKNIKAYTLEWAGEYVWYRPDLMKKKTGSVPHSAKFFEVAEKIVIQRVNSSMQLLATYDNEKKYFLDTVNVSRYESWDKEFSMKYICGILNSRMINFWYSHKYRMPTIGGYELETIPIVPITQKEQLPIISLVDTILNKKKVNSSFDITKERKEIDRLVYDIYGLTYAEIAIIEGSIK